MRQPIFNGARKIKARINYKDYQDIIKCPDIDKTQRRIVLATYVALHFYQNISMSTLITKAFQRKLNRCPNRINQRIREAIIWLEKNGLIEVKNKYGTPTESVDLRTKLTVEIFRSKYDGVRSFDITEEEIVTISENALSTDNIIDMLAIYVMIKSCIKETTGYGILRINPFKSTDYARGIITGQESGANMVDILGLGKAKVMRTMRELLSNPNILVGYTYFTAPHNMRATHYYFYSTVGEEAKRKVDNEVAQHFRQSFKDEINNQWYKYDKKTDSAIRLEKLRPVPFVEYGANGQRTYQYKRFNPLDRDALIWEEVEMTRENILAFQSRYDVEWVNEIINEYQENGTPLEFMAVNHRMYKNKYNLELCIIARGQHEFTRIGHKTTYNLNDEYSPDVYKWFELFEYEWGRTHLKHGTNTYYQDERHTNKYRRQHYATDLSTKSPKLRQAIADSIQEMVDSKYISNYTGIVNKQGKLNYKNVELQFAKMVRYLQLKLRSNEKYYNALFTKENCMNGFSAEPFFNYRQLIRPSSGIALSLCG